MPHERPFEDSGQPTLTWTNVGFGLAFILIDVGISTVFRLGVGLSLLIAALRCIGQLGVVATILQQVFENKDPWLVALISCEYFLLSLHYFHTKDTLVVLNFLGTFETGASRVFHHGFSQLTRDIQLLTNHRVASVTWSGITSILAF